MFSEPDPLEEDMKVLCEDMSAEQLVTYVKEYQSLVNAIELKIEGQRERAVFLGMHRIYGKKTTGQIVKWAMIHHHGKWEGDFITHFSFTKARKWWVDKLHLELQQALRKEKPAEASRVMDGFATATALL